MKLAAAALLLALLPVPHSPRVASAMPAGAQRGTEVEVELRGERLDDPLGLLGDTAGIEVLEVKSDKPERCTLRLRLAPDCGLGARLWRLRTAEGLSNALWFHVGGLPELRAQPGKEPQRLAQGCTVNGELAENGCDRFAVELAAGGRLCCEVEALRLGFAAADLALGVRGADGAELAAADDSIAGLKDPLLAFAAPRAGVYTIEVKPAFADRLNRGVYRLHVTAAPRPLWAVPCGGAPGEQLAVELLADGEVRRTAVRLPDAECDAWPWYPELDGVPLPTPVFLRVGGPPNRAAAADAKGSRFVPVPGSVHGIVGDAGGERFWIHAEKGQQLQLTVLARSLRSPLDPLLIVRQQDGRYLASNDDQRSSSLDCGLRFTAPADGDYQLEVRDLLRRSSPLHGFRLEVAPPAQPLALKLNVGRRDEAALELPQGGRIGGVLQLSNADREAGLELLAQGLPAGVGATFAPPGKGLNQLPFVLDAAADAPLAGAMLGFAARSADAAAPRDAGYLQEIALVSVRNDQPLVTASLRALPVAVVAPMPFALELVPPTVPLVRGAPLGLQVKVRRQPGHKERIRVRALWTPPGVSAGQCTLDAGQDEAVLPLSANDGARLGSHPLIAVATVYRRGGRRELGSAPVSLQVDEPWLRVTAGSARTEPGTPVELRLAVAAKRPLPHGCRLRLLSLPRGVEADELQLPGDADAAAFALRVAADAPPGRHRGVLVEARIATDGGDVTCRFAAGELRIDRPLPQGAVPGMDQPPAARPAAEVQR